MKPICVKCQCFYRPAKNGVCVLENMPKISGAPRGLVAPETWEPYKLWRADKWKCPDCGHEIISGAGSSNFHEHYLPGFNEAVEDWKKTGHLYPVNDC